MIIVSGENIYPSEIEKFLPKLKELKEGYIVGLIDQIKGSQICLIYDTDFNNDELLIKNWRNFLSIKFHFTKFQVNL